VVTKYFKVLSWNSPGGTEENHKLPKYEAKVGTTSQSSLPRKGILPSTVMIEVDRMMMRRKRMARL